MLKSVSIMTEMSCFSIASYRATDMKVPEPMQRPVADADQPRLCIWTTRKKLVRCGKWIVCYLELARLNINRHDPASVAFFHLRPHSLLVDRLTSPGELLFAITRLSCSHAVPLSQISISSAES